MIKQRCPLVVKWASWEDPTLILRGADWSLQCTSAWRLVSDATMVGGCEDASAGDVVLALRDQEIVACEPLTRAGIPDLRLVFSGGLALEVFAASSLEPWVLRLPGGPTLVPSPTAPEWFDRVS